MSDTADATSTVIYQNEDGGLALDVAVRDESVWMRQEQMSRLFGRERSVVTKHLRNVFAEGELEANAVCAKFAHTAADGKTYQVEHYNLDVIISVGYRVKSPQGVRFRQWATRVLKQHLLQGYTVNQQRLEQNAAELEKALLLVRRAARLPAGSTVGTGLAEVISRYTQTFLWLQQYDEGLLQRPAGQPGGQLTPLADARGALLELKQHLIKRGEASELFARERDDGLAAIWGALEQSVFGEPAYPTVESKAAHFCWWTFCTGSSACSTTVANPCLTMRGWRQ